MTAAPATTPTASRCVGSAAPAVPVACARAVGVEGCGGGRGCERACCSLGAQLSARVTDTIAPPPSLPRLDAPRHRTRHGSRRTSQHTVAAHRRAPCDCCRPSCSPHAPPRCCHHCSLAAPPAATTHATAHQLPLQLPPHTPLLTRCPSRWHHAPALASTCPPAPALWPPPPALAAAAAAAAVPTTRAPPPPPTPAARAAAARRWPQTVPGTGRQGRKVSERAKVGEGVSGCGAGGRGRQGQRVWAGIGVHVGSRW